MKNNVYYFVATVLFIASTFCAEYKEKKDKLSILVVVPEFPKIGDVCMLNQIILLIDAGHNVSIFARSMGKMEVLQREVIEYNLMDKLIHTTFPADTINQFDVIIFQLGHLAFNVKQEYNFQGKIAICLRGYDISAFTKNNPHAYDEAFQYCDLFLPVCDVFKDRIIELGADPHKVLTLYSAIDYEKFYNQNTDVSNKQLTILSACRFVEKKGIEYAIYALKFLVKEYPSIHYTIIGGGKEKRKYQEIIKKLNLEKYISIESWVNHDQLAHMLHNTFICLIPSISAKNGDQEGIPNIMKEAMAAGCFVIATPSSGIQEILFHEKTGFYVKERDALTIAMTINDIIRNSNKYKEILTLAQKLISNFDKNIIKSKLNKALLQLCAKKGE